MTKRHYDTKGVEADVNYYAIPANLMPCSEDGTHAEHVLSVPTVIDQMVLSRIDYIHNEIAQLQHLRKQFLLAYSGARLMKESPIISQKTKQIGIISCGDFDTTEIANEIHQRLDDLTSELYELQYQQRKA